MQEKTKSLLEGVFESTAACLLAMVQGNLLAVTVGHLVIAAQTGVVAGVLALLLSLVVRVKAYWVAPLLLSLCTALVDYFVHPGSFGSIATEAIVTGLIAGLLCLLVGLLLRLRRPKLSNPGA
ncbi:hypothetical protein EYC98_08805 [Halieaceae bacterium IMCC14734]|uniref:Uncharacterized protein n=1 Tax=Candidatus Litorirhabdus singularis TaxID=2518993 RepID=A0ABT3TF92_9GAMM|nr:hypothetical protein [Candidatus Litorirhabdus singularis]MCX2980961.1 hypothetical protein [Candidatus Litorirhabdus singularis]